MRTNFIVLFILASIACKAQNDTANADYGKHAPYERHSVIISASLGFIDNYRQAYTLPTGFQKGNTSGFVPFNVKLEYGLGRHISIAATMGYDAFLYNYKQDYTGNNGPFTRSMKDNTRILSGGVTGFYHLDKQIHIKHLDPFVGFGLSLSNIRYGSYPQGDSTVTKINHEITPYLKAGARYYITSAFSIFADAGYEKQSMINIGGSCRFFSRKKMAR